MARWRATELDQPFAAGGRGYRIGSENSSQLNAVGTALFLASVLILP